MSTGRWLSVALGLVVMGAAPLVAQQPRATVGDQPMSPREGAVIPMHHGQCPMMTASETMQVEIAGNVDETETARQRVRRASGPSRLRIVAAPKPETSFGDSVAAYQTRGRRATGPSRLSPGIVWWHSLGAADGAAQAPRHPATRATGPSRFPRM